MYYCMHHYMYNLKISHTYNNKWQRSAHHNMLFVLILLSYITFFYLTLISL